MRLFPSLIVLAILGAASVPASAQNGHLPHVAGNAAGNTSVSDLSGRAPWQAQWEYDSGSDQDRRPELPYYQQGRGQQTGGPARNLIASDPFHIVPR